MNSITIYYNGNGMLISKDYANLVGLSDGYRIKTEAEFWEILDGHARHQVEILTMLIDAEKSLN